VSPKRDKTVRELVEKYRERYPFLERPLIRKLIRLENRNLFPPESSGLRKLSRELKRSFTLKPYLQPLNVTDLEAKLKPLIEIADAPYLKKPHCITISNEKETIIKIQFDEETSKAIEEYIFKLGISGHEKKEMFKSALLRAAILESNWQD